MLSNKFFYIYHVKLSCFDTFPRLSRAAMAKFEDIKEQSATGLKHAIEQHKYTDIRVDLKPSYVIIPHGGVYKK